jgi:hypothetical protein
VAHVIGVVRSITRIDGIRAALGRAEPSEPDGS